VTAPETAAAGIEDAVSVLDLLRRRLQAGPPIRFGFEDGWHGLSDIDELSDRCAEFLLRLGVREGDRVCAMLFNNLEHLIVWLAAGKVGAIFTPVNTSYQGEWLRHQLCDAEPTVLVVETELNDRIRALHADLPEGLTTVVRGDIAAAGGVALDGYRECPRIAAPFVPAPSTISHIIYTSGTTGRSKGCLVSHGYLLSYARLRLAEVPRRPGEASFTALPLFHLAGLGSTIGSLIVGADAYLARRFSASGFWAEIERSGARYVQLLGSMAPILAKGPDSEESRRCFGQIRVLTGSAVPEVNRALRDRFGVQSTDIKFYGQTEACPIATTGGRPVRESSVGVPNEAFEVRVVDDADHEVAAGKVGHIVCRPTRPNVMFSGYWRNPEATMAKSTTLWWHTGDYGYFDENGYLCFSDRGDDRMRRGGENVSSYEVEAAVARHAEIANVAAHAVPSELSEDEIKLTAVVRQGSALTPAELWEWCHHELPKFAVPRYIEFRAELPLTPTGKIQKHLLRNEGVTDTTWDSAATKSGQRA
jgi:carnitine-CoA ligase